MNLRDYFSPAKGPENSSKAFCQTFKVEGNLFKRLAMAIPKDHFSIMQKKLKEIEDSRKEKPVGKEGNKRRCSDIMEMYSHNLKRIKNTE